ncbi:putative l-carnitine dehydratase/bile acid-inducible protein F [Mycobacterium xenopi 3993]|nr:putative l-carnitine dehydratase/bile acid-inducible protein F [Mycobacterium xenopi 3993]
MTEACAEGGASGCGGDATMTTHDPLPLVDVRVLDLASGEADAISRILADLGADVLKIEPPGGSPGRVALPAVAGFSIGFALHNANKRSAVLNPTPTQTGAGFLSWSPAQTSSLTAEFRVWQERSARPAQDWPTGLSGWSRCTSLISAPTARTRPGRPPIR